MTRLLLVLFLIIPSIPPVSAQEPFVLLSTQLKPIKEAEIVRNVILADFPESVDFQPIDDRPLFYQLATEVAVEGYHPGLLAGAHSEFMSLLTSGSLRQLDAVVSPETLQRIPNRLLQLGRLGQQQLYFLPWMQGGYIMVAHRRALPYLPPGAELSNLSYAQLVDWAARIHAATGEAKLGYPVGEHGLMHRFLEGYLYPAYTGAMIHQFAAPQAVPLWENLREQWRYVNPLSLSFDSMSEPLLSGEIWIAWDHTARLFSVFEQAPEEFVAFPAPTGPQGRGHIFVLAGLAIPTHSTDPAKAARLMEFLVTPPTQHIILEQLGFLPVVDIQQDDNPLPSGLTQLVTAVQQQANDEHSIPFPLPVGLGNKSREFDLIYLLTFSRIVLRGEDIQTVLKQQAAKLRDITASVNAPCWSPQRLRFVDCGEL